MIMHLLTAESAPGSGGVGDYTHLLAAALTQRGLQVRTWDTQAPGLRLSLESALAREGGFVLLQYVPNALGARGANLDFCLWLLGLKRRGHDVRVMFHEPYFYFSRHALRNVLAVVQRGMAAALLRAATHVYVSTEAWQRYLEPFAPSGTEFCVMPVPSTLPTVPPAAGVAAWRARLLADGDALAGHFGTYGDHVAPELSAVVPALLGELPHLRFVCIGRRSDLFTRALLARHPELASRLSATGAIGDIDAAAAIAACDLMVQPYPDGVTTRRTSVMAPLALGVATVTSRGFLTEPVWEATGTAVLATAGDHLAHARAAESLLRNDGTRRQQGEKGRAAYAAHFSLDRTIDMLLRPSAVTV